MKNILSTVKSTAVTALLAVEEKAEVVKAAHTVKSSLTPEQRKALKNQAKQAKAMQAQMLLAMAEQVKITREAEVFTSAWTQAAKNFQEA